jgi:hypothetical protein
LDGNFDVISRRRVAPNVVELPVRSERFAIECDNGIARAQSGAFRGAVWRDVVYGDAVRVRVKNRIAAKVKSKLDGMSQAPVVVHPETGVQGGGSTENDGDEI